MHFSICLCIFKVFKGASKSHEKGHFPETLKCGGGGTCPLCLPVPTSMVKTRTNFAVNASTSIEIDASQHTTYKVREETDGGMETSLP